MIELSSDSPVQGYNDVQLEILRRIAERGVLTIAISPNTELRKYSLVFQHILKEINHLKRRVNDQ